MAVLSADELAEIRRWAARLAKEKGVGIHWNKGEINAALQALEDRVEAAGTQSALSADVDAAAPGVFNSNEKKILWSMYLIQKAKREKELVT